MKRWKWGFKLACALWFFGGLALVLSLWLLSVNLAFAAETGSLGEGSDAAGTVVEYEDLRELLKAGNAGLKQTKEEQENSIAPYKEMQDILQEEQKYMEEMAESYEDDGNTEMQEFYEERAKQLKMAASQTGTQIRRMSSYSQEKAYEKQVDVCLVAAQALMNSYNQMEEQIKAQEKQAEYRKASCEEAAARYRAGLVKEDEVLSAENFLTASNNTLASLKKQRDEIKESLLSMLGLSGETEIQIGAIPEPDMEAIGAVDFESDKQTAVRNDSTYVSELNSKVKGTDARELRSRRVEDAEASELISITSFYEELQNKRLEYEAAMEAYEAAGLQYQALLRKKQAGLLSQTDYLQGEASYEAKRAAKEVSAMNLFQAYESYQWEVKGRINASI